MEATEGAEKREVFFSFLRVAVMKKVLTPAGSKRQPATRLASACHASCHALRVVRVEPKLILHQLY